MNTPGYLRCAYCDVHTSTHLSYIEHVRTIHNGNHTIDHKCLDSEDDFKGWLISLKKKFGVDFVKRRGDKNKTTGRTVRMFCSRSGSATESSKLTQSGIIPKISIRCGKDCTAFLLAHVTESSINVQYCLEHAGHIIEAEDGKWMRLSTEERNWILALLRDNRSALHHGKNRNRRDIYDIDRRHNARKFRLDNDDLSSIRKREAQDEDLHGFVEPTNDTGEGILDFVQEGIVPLFLMSDDSNAFVNAYKEAFGGASSGTQHILCSWHVKRSWNRRLDVDVKDPEKREIMKQYLNKIPRYVTAMTYPNTKIDKSGRVVHLLGADGILILILVMEHNGAIVAADLAKEIYMQSLDRIAEDLR
ncbi:hypothetical protein QR680_012186 [Steinernema hermaphroditum]|uniref:C2H2-type domain-containing protein n=1 Tax=Steinernema hermaphroditum TaxID=289476 RepID=A0AA39I2J1_9BILA|nr:hypothetical protein QR680_012186 [Steinernema hermaphroditum]